MYADFSVIGKFIKKNKKKDEEEIFLDILIYSFDIADDCAGTV